VKLGNVWRWLLDRAALTPASLAALDKPLPRGVGWLNTLGSTALMVLVLQFVTGMFLMMNYTPVVGGAWESVLYIDTVVTCGRLIHGLHHYGASAAVIVVGLHLLRVYLHAAYKPPRELVWILGVILLLLVLGFGFTGYLLPWDQKAYWATEVGTEIPASAPVIGPLLKQVMRGGDEIGQATLTRFYALHVAILPMLLLLTMGAHLLLVWRQGPTSPGYPVGEEAPKASRFVQHQLFKDAVAMFVAVVVIFALALLRPVHLELLADPSGLLDPHYKPRPEWYFLFLFQFLKDVGRVAPWLPEWIPALVIPGVGVAYLLLLPWIDRTPERRVRRRPLVVGVLAVALVGMVALTAEAYLDAPRNKKLRDVAYGELTDEGRRERDPAFLSAAERGATLLEEKGCLACHVYRGQGRQLGPDLDLAGFKHSRAWLVEKIRDPQSKMEGGQPSRMPPYGEERLPEEELAAILAAVSRRQPVLEYRGP